MRKTGGNIGGKWNYFHNFSPKFSSLLLCIGLLSAGAILSPGLQWSRNLLVGFLQKHQWLLSAAC